MYNRGRLYGICLVASLGGILFGFDLVIISGTIPFFRQYFQLSEAGVGWAVGCVNLGAALGALVAGRLSDRFGRKKLLLCCAVLFALTGPGTGWAGQFGWFIVCRLLSGTAVGIASLVCPVYIAEISPTAFRGRMVSFYQLAIVSGLLLAYLADYLLLDTGSDNWRWMFSSQAVPALLFFSGLFFVAESPRWLVGKGRLVQALKVLESIGGPLYGEEQLTRIQDSFKTSSGSDRKRDWKVIFRKEHRKVALLGICVAVFSQADGQNSLFSYAPEIFRQAGMGRDSAIFQSVALGVVNFLFTFIAIGSIDRYGRRKLLLVGSLLLSLDAALLALTFALSLPSYWIMVEVLAFIAIYAATLGPVTWVALSELFPNKVRGDLMSVATLSLWIANFITTASFPVMRAQWGLPLTFGLHALICLAYFFFVRSKVPETKGRSLEEIETLVAIPSH
ncbi:MAG: sugar porter family MFS transporter [Chitinophagaceae bacterium]|nr:sugar porter family MFS transporter [Chitinophagaceae bacterium]